MAQDSIMDWVNNDESFYSDKNALFDRWVDEGEVWGEREARQEAETLVRGFAQLIDQEQTKYDQEPYTEKDIREAVDEMLKEFEEYREEEIQERIRQTTRVAKPEELALDAGDISHAERYEPIARKIGIKFLQGLMPASREAIRKALDRGDKHLNTIKLRKWDDAASRIPGRDLALFEKVSVLKHVARWHYA